MTCEEESIWDLSVTERGFSLDSHLENLLLVLAGD
jgi:hypothetical protein